MKRSINGRGAYSSTSRAADASPRAPHDVEAAALAKANNGINDVDHQWPAEASRPWNGFFPSLLQVSPRLDHWAPSSRLFRFPKLAKDALQRVDDFLSADPALRETELQVERLGRRPVGK